MRATSELILTDYVMLFYITYLADEQRQRISGKGVFADNEDEACKIFHDVTGHWAMDVEECPNKHEHFMERGLPLGEFILGDHPYEDGVNHIKA